MKQLLIPIKDLSTNENKLWKISEKNYNKIIQQITPTSDVNFNEKLEIQIDKEYNVKIIGISSLNDK